MKISLIVAVAENGVIGRDGGLPWRLPSDLKTFRRLTMDKPMIMGRRTYQSIGRPLDGRDSIVVTRDPHFEVEGVSTCDSLSDALTMGRIMATTRGADEIMVIGGAGIFEASLPVADRIYMTLVHASPAGDTYFKRPGEAEWREVRQEPLPQGPKDEFASTLFIYERREEIVPDRLRRP